MFETFETAEIETDKTRIFLRHAGVGPPLLLLHGFPQTHVMWHRIAPALARRFHVVCADLSGYGQSGCPPSSPDHAPYAKRAMACDMVAVMDRLGFARFSVVGHDRGGRVAYRLALDHADRIERCAVLDIVPTAVAWERADDRFAFAYWPWSILAQDAPFPESLIGAAPRAIVDSALSGWGTVPEIFDAEVRNAYVRALSDPVHVHAICEEYRAAAGLDRHHDEADRRAGRRIHCPLLVLWSAAGPLADWYEDAGGPLGIWRQWADEVEGHTIAGGHFFPEERPTETQEALEAFLATAA